MENSKQRDLVIQEITEEVRKRKNKQNLEKPKPAVKKPKNEYNDKVFVYHHFEDPILNILYNSAAAEKAFQVRCN